MFYSRVLGNRWKDVERKYRLGTKSRGSKKGFISHTRCHDETKDLADQNEVIRSKFRFMKVTLELMKVLEATICNEEKAVPLTQGVMVTG